MGSAGESLGRLIQELGAGSIDMAFIDADKRQYWTYFEQLLELVRPGGLIIADNVLFYGKVSETVRKKTLGFKFRHATKPDFPIAMQNMSHQLQVADPDSSDKAATALADFNKKLFVDERIDLSIIPVGDGMALARKR